MFSKQNKSTNIFNLDNRSDSYIFTFEQTGLIRCVLVSYYVIDNMITKIASIITIKKHVIGFVSVNVGELHLLVFMLNSELTYVIDLFLLHGNTEKEGSNSRRFCVGK